MVISSTNQWHCNVSKHAVIIIVVEQHTMMLEKMGQLGLVEAEKGSYFSSN